MKTRIPKSVNIFGHTYSIKVVPSAKIDGGAAGLMRFPQREILIAKEQSKEIRWITFLHEISHARHYELGYTQIFSEQVAESDCEQFASLITSLQKQKIL